MMAIQSVASVSDRRSIDSNTLVTTGRKHHYRVSLRMGEVGRKGVYVGIWTQAQPFAECWKSTTKNWPRSLCSAWPRRDMIETWILLVQGRKQPESWKICYSCGRSPSAISLVFKFSCCGRSGGRYKLRLWSAYHEPDSKQRALHASSHA